MPRLRLPSTDGLWKTPTKKPTLEKGQRHADLSFEVLQAACRTGRAFSRSDRNFRATGLRNLVPAVATATVTTDLIEPEVPNPFFVD
jgi:hypothetical protein